MNKAARNTCEQVFVHMHAFISLVYILGVEFMGHKVCLTFWGTDKWLSKAPVPFYISTSNIGRSNFSTSMPTTCYYLSFFIITSLVGLKWYLNVVLNYISLMTNDVEHFHMWLLSIIYLLWRNIYSKPLPNLNGFLCLL